MTARWFYPLVGIAALAAGTGLWLATRAPAPATFPATAPTIGTPSIGPAALLATPFTDLEGRAQSLAQFQGKVVVLNFWATWCAPCREEMPAFTRIQARWGGRGVQVVGVSSEDSAKVAAFGRELGVNYPLWVGEAASELSRRLGNSSGVLPHSAILDGSGKVLEQKVGPYSESELESKQQLFGAKSP
jgi:thiol-disulfide isomerase/thioredoxin